jgi:hypothetical protein
MRPADNIEKSIKKLRYETDAETHKRVLGNVLQRLDEHERQKRGVVTPNIWRTIMKSRITKIAAAAAIMIAVLVGLDFLGNPLAPTVTWAQIIQPILSAQTAEFDIIVGEEGKGPVIHDMVMGSRIRRTVEGINQAVIIDLESSKLLTLVEQNKTAVFIDLKNLPKIPENYLERLQNLVSVLEDDPNFVIEELAEEQIEGRPCVGFLASRPESEVIIWADSETALPIRIEQREHQMTVICKNFEFDPQMDETLFSMDVPEDYTLQEQQLDLKAGTEEEFIEGLRIRTEVIGDGVFPEDVSVGYYIKNVARVSGKLSTLNISDSEKGALGMKLARHLLFLRFFEGEGKWHWAGVGVELGEAETPIFWYRPKDSETWRVIYGDLHVEDVAEQDLPESEPALSEKQAKIIRSSEQWQEQEFVGSEKDVWHITASGDIVAHSHITLTKMPQNAGLMYINLPYSSAVLESVILDDKEVPFSMVTRDRYELELPAENLLEGLEPVECFWSMPLEALVKVDYGYRIRLQGLIPVESFVLTTVLEPDCGLEYTKDPSQTQTIPFSWKAKSPKMHFGSCGLLVQKRN